ncbi:MAG: Ig-like domain-containing protein [Myxococcota bacterium]|nr:Ig-like domain-containing protein [Myxococcota bacterium]MDW8361686.1 hypothetical protein [Myxococcales bacterium]
MIGVSARATAVVVALLGGCDGAGRAPPPGDGGARADRELVEPALLVLESAPAVTLAYGERTELVVRHVELDGVRPVPGATVSIALVGRANDSTLSATERVTDADGRARVTLVAGGTPSLFRVRLATARAAAVHVDVSVSGTGFGRLRVRVRHRGARTLDERRVGVVLGETCPAFPWPDGAPSRWTGLAPGSDEASVYGLPADVPLVVLAEGLSVRGTGEGRYAVVAAGCADGVAVRAGEVGDAEVEVRDLPLDVSGRFEARITLRNTELARLARGEIVAGAERILAVDGGAARSLLDALERTLRAAGADDEADVLVARRRDGMLEAALADDLARRRVGPVTDLERIADEARRWMSAFALEGVLQVGREGTGRWDSTSLVLLGEEPGDGRLELMLPAPSLEGRWNADPTRAALRVEGVGGVLELGRLVRASVEAVVGASGAVTVLDALAAGGTCDAFESFVHETGELSALCDGRCARNACKAAFERLWGGAVERVEALSARCRDLWLDGAAVFVERDGDLVVDGIESALGDLQARWTGPTATSGERLDAALHGWREAP